MALFNFTVHRSNRKTLCIQINNDATLHVYAPLNVSTQTIKDFILSKKNWITKKLNAIALNQNNLFLMPKLTDKEILDLKKNAKKIIPPKVKYYAALLNVSYGRICFRCQKTLWGSCSSNGNLSFNCLLLLAPDKVLDSVIVHELCHRKYMNHSKAFYNLVLSVYPEYYEHNKWLKDNGAVLLNRIP